MNTAQYTAIALPGIPDVRKGDDLARIVMDALDQMGQVLQHGDIIVLAQKIVSKAEGRVVLLDEVTVTPEARDLAHRVKKDPRLVTLALAESARVVRALPGLLILEHRLGFVMANAGIDQSNVSSPDGQACALLLPVDPDESARRVADALYARTGCRIAVLVNDSFGRPWRQGTVGVCLGAAGFPAVQDLRGECDMNGRVLHSTIVGLGDEIAAAASLLMGQAAQRQPAVLIRGYAWDAPECNARALVRPLAEDRFR